MKTKEITLSSGQVIVMREPKVKDMRLIAGIKDEIEQDIRMFCNLVELSPEEIEDLPLKDFNSLQEAFRSFLA